MCQNLMEGIEEEEDMILDRQAEEIDRAIERGMTSTQHFRDEVAKLSPHQKKLSLYYIFEQLGDKEKEEVRNNDRFKDTEFDRIRKQLLLEGWRESGPHYFNGEDGTNFEKDGTVICLKFNPFADEEVIQDLFPEDEEYCSKFEEHVFDDVVGQGLHCTCCGYIPTDKEAEQIRR